LTNQTGASNFGRISAHKWEEGGAVFGAGRLKEERRKPMSNRMLNMSVAAVLAAGVATASTVASAMPLADALAIKNAAGTDVQKVWGRGFGWGLGAGLLGGAIIGSALARPYYYGPYYPYYGPAYYPPPAYGPGYYPAPAYGPGYPGPADGGNGCARRYKSYDPASGTFLGHDGARHPCP
jgi:hypothetical protein